MVKPIVSASDWASSGAFLTTTPGLIAYREQGRGPALVLLHGFPTWSYDYAEVAPMLAANYRVITLDFPGYGFSAKRGAADVSVGGAADAVEAVLRHLGIDRATLVIHDFGGIVGQELLDRRRGGRLPFKIDGLHVLNNGIVYAAYRPTRLQKMLATPVIGGIVARRITKERTRVGLNSVRGTVKLGEAEFEQLWIGMARDEGHKRADKLIGYNAERVAHNERWETALFGFEGPVQLIWGMADPVSGRHVLDLARPCLPHARIVELEGVGHFPQSEAPGEVAAAIGRGFA